MRPKPMLVLFLTTLLVSKASLAATITLKDPKGDDDGPGTYTYPTDAVYTPGSFDMTQVRVRQKGKNVQFKVTIVAPIEDPWNSKSWNGHGFSIQFIQIYLDLDHNPGSGQSEALPGIHVKFPEESYWDKVVLISPQPTSRVQSEIDIKAPKIKDKIIIPKVTRAQGNTFLAVVPAEALGGGLPDEFGIQVIMQSNEGFPAPTDMLTRKVNEYNGQHRFGGGSDYDCDPHVMDILVPPAKGEKDEIEKQHEILKQYTCSDDESKWVLAVVPMVYVSKR